MGLIEDGLAMLNEVLGAEGSVAIVYHRGGYELPLNAVPSKPPFVSPQGAPPDPAKAERNFSVLASELVDGDNLPLMPVLSDSITEQINGTTYVYTVANPQSGIGCWEWDSGYMAGSPVARILVHTKSAGTQ